MSKVEGLPIQGAVSRIILSEQAAGCSYERTEAEMHLPRTFFFREQRSADSLLDGPDIFVQSLGETSAPGCTTKKRTRNNPSFCRPGSRENL
jgi:hypothetical protein